MKQLWTDITAILKAPFVGDLDIIHLCLLVGLVLVFIAGWIMVLNHVRAAATEVV